MSSITQGPLARQHNSAEWFNELILDSKGEIRANLANAVTALLNNPHFEQDIKRADFSYLHRERPEIVPLACDWLQRIGINVGLTVTEAAFLAARPYANRTPKGGAK